MTFKMFIKILKNIIQEKVLTDFDDMIPDTVNNKKINPVVTESFISGRKLNILFVLHNNILKYQEKLD